MHLILWQAVHRDDYISSLCPLNNCISRLYFYLRCKNTIYFYVFNLSEILYVIINYISLSANKTYIYLES